MKREFLLHIFLLCCSCCCCCWGCCQSTLWSMQKSKGRKLWTDWFACRRKLIRKRNETKFPNCWCGVKTFLYFCHLIEIEWFSSFTSIRCVQISHELMDLANAAAKMMADSCALKTVQIWSLRNQLTDIILIERSQYKWDHSQKIYTYIINE